MQLTAWQSMSGRLGGGALARRAPARPALLSQRTSAVVRAGLFDDMFNFEKWAPRSAQAWRYGRANFRQSQDEEDATSSSGSSITEESVDLLNERLASARRAEARGGGGAPPVKEEEEDGQHAGAAAASSGSSAGEELPAPGSQSQQQQQQQPSFLSSTDEELADALNQRIGLLGSRDYEGGGAAPAGVGAGEDEEEGEGAEALTGALLKQLIYEKYGKYYDITFARRDLPLGKVLVCLNIMWVHAEQRSFPMTEAEFDEKLEAYAFYLNAWGQAQRVLDFLRQPAKPRKGMPSRPIVGCAVSVHLDLSQQVIDEFFGQGGS